MRVLAGLLCVVLLAACGTEAPPADPSDASPYLGHRADAEYVGRDACASCHADKAASFAASQMGRSFRPATLQNSNADFDAPDPIHDAELDLYYQPFARGDSLFVREYRLAGADTVHSRVVRIDWIVGSGHHTNSHMRSENGYLYQVPVTWYAQAGRWGLAPGFHTRTSGRFDRAIELECMACHNGMSDFAEGSANRFDALAHGIGCERCHGPGSFHVEAKRRGEIVDVTREVDYSIVNPAKLPLDRQLDVCQRCHMQGAAALQPGRDWYDHRPGMALDSVFNVFWPRFEDSTTVFLMASHPDRLRMSACFTESHARADVEAMTCTTCHDPHQPIDAFTPESFTATCQSCHDEPHVAACTEDAAARAAVGDDCASCHMPTSPTQDIPNVTVTDHFIRVPEPPARPLRTTGFPTSADGLVRFASLTNDAPTAHERARGLLTYYEQFAPIPALLDSARTALDVARAEEAEAALAQTLVRFHFLAGEHDAVRRLAGRVPAESLSDAWTQYRIGESWIAGGDAARGATHYERAVRLAPATLAFRTKLASAYATIGRLDEALAQYDAVVAAAPTRSDALNNRGLVRLQLQDVGGAEVDFRQALRLDPDHEMALANLASLLFNTDRRAEALPLAERLVVLAPGNARYRQFEAMLRQ